MGAAGGVASSTTHPRALANSASVRVTTLPLRASMRFRSDGRRASGTFDLLASAFARSSEALAVTRFASSLATRSAGLIGSRMAAPVHGLHDEVDAAGADVATVESVSVGGSTVRTGAYQVATGRHTHTAWQGRSCRKRGGPTAGGCRTGRRACSTYPLGAAQDGRLW